MAGYAVADMELYQSQTSVVSMRLIAEGSLQTLSPCCPNMVAACPREGPPETYAPTTEQLRQVGDASTLDIGASRFLAVHPLPSS